MATNNDRPGPDIRHVREAMREHDRDNPPVEPHLGEDGPADETEAVPGAQPSRAPERP